MKSVTVWDFWHVVKKTSGICSNDPTKKKQTFQTVHFISHRHFSTVTLLKMKLSYTNNQSVIPCSGGSNTKSAIRIWRHVCRDMTTWRFPRAEYHGMICVWSAAFLPPSCSCRSAPVPKQSKGRKAEKGKKGTFAQKASCCWNWNKLLNCWLMHWGYWVHIRPFPQMWRRTALTCLQSIWILKEGTFGHVHMLQQRQVFTVSV